jgi:methyl coenzyme M reductase subunit C-like uncharacterized protein (methanogenesis marker protein 7)
MQTNCVAVAKLVQNKKLNTLRLLVTFDTVAGKVTVLNAAYKSGDICNIGDSKMQYYVEKEIALAKKVLRTNNIQFV